MPQSKAERKAREAFLAGVADMDNEQLLRAYVAAEGEVAADRQTSPAGDALVGWRVRTLEMELRGRLALCGFLAGAPPKPSEWFRETLGGLPADDLVAVVISRSLGGKNMTDVEYEWAQCHLVSRVDCNPEEEGA